MKEGDLVRVQRPVRKSKLHQRLSEPLEMVENRGHDAYCLSDGTRWHTGRLVSVPMTTTAGGVEEEGELPGEERTTRSTGSEATEGGEQLSARPSRLRRSPTWHKDYEIFGIQ